jgi:hypothetical protein
LTPIGGRSGRIVFQNQTGFFTIDGPTAAEIEISAINKLSLSFRVEKISEISNKSTRLIKNVWNCRATNAVSENFVIIQENDLLIATVDKDKKWNTQIMTNLIGNVNDIVDIKSTHLAELFVKTKVY